ncbi:hypothetical protein M9458_050635, partial [Cirrhinus mrigala]
PFSARLFVPASDYYGNVAGLDERAYKAMPRVEQTLASYLSPGAASSLKAPTLPSKPLRTTSALVGKRYTAAGQAGACLHTMSVLQAYQADLLKGLAKGEKVDLEELRRTADLALRTTKETAQAVGWSMAAMVAAERHLWLTLSDMKEKDRVFLLDAPLEPSCLFGDAVDSVVSRYQEARKQAAAFQRFLPRHSLASAAAGHEQLPACTSSSYREVQKLSVATRAPPSRNRDQRHSRPGSSKAGPDLRAVLQSRRPPAKCSVNTRGQPLAASSLSRLFSSVEATAKCVCMGPAHCRKRLLHSVRRPAAALRRGLSHSGGPRAGSGHGTRSRHPSEEGGHRGGPSSREGVRVLQLVLHSSKEGWRAASHYRSSPSQSLSYEVEVQDAYCQASSVTNQVRGLVCDDRSERRVLPQHRKFLRFAFRGEAYQYWVLPFGLVLSPRTFKKCVDAALVPLRLQGIRILNYIDDWLILAESESLAARHRDVVLAHMKTLGLRLNAKKSVLSPLQRTTYLGVVWDSTTMQARLSPARIESILAAVARVKEGRSLTVKQFQQLLGLWSGRYLSWHINCLEMLAIFRALKYFLPDLRDRHVLVRTDNTGRSAFAPLVGADVLSRQGPRPGEWMLHPEVVKQIWKVFGPALVDLFAMRENAQCPLWYSLVHPAPLGLDAMVQTWPRLCLYAFPGESPPGRGQCTVSSPILAGPSMVLGPDFSPRRLSMGDSCQEGSSLTGGGYHPSPPSGAVEAVGVASEEAQLIASGLSTEVLETILQSRSPSTRKLYVLKWKLFTSWCGERQQDPVNCPAGTVLEFLQARFSTGLSHSTLKVYVAAISAYHAPLGGLSVGKDPWLYVSSVVGDLQALSVAPSYLEFAPGMTKAFLYPKAGYVPKVPTTTPQPVVLQAFCPPPFREPDQQKLNCMCPVRALDAYVHRAALWRKSDQLFVCYGPPKKGHPATKQTLSRWIVDAISSAYESSDLPLPLGVKAHSTRAMAASRALMLGVPIQDICNAAGWSTPLTFVRFYNLDVRATPGSSILLP